MVYFTIIVVCGTILGIVYLCIMQIEKMSAREYDISLKELGVELEKVKKGRKSEL